MPDLWDGTAAVQQNLSSMQAEAPLNNTNDKANPNTPFHPSSIPNELKWICWEFHKHILQNIKELSNTCKVQKLLWIAIFVMFLLLFATPAP